MRVKNLTLAELEKRVITIGFVDENLYTQVRIDCKELFDEHPDAIPSLAVQPPQGDAYPAVVTREGDIVVWNVAKSDVQYANLGRLQLTFVIGEIVAKSYVGKFVIDKSLMPDGEAPTPIENWITEANAVLGEIPGTIAEAVDDALEEAKESGEFDGADGVSPTVTVTKTKDGHNVVITDAEGDHSFDVPDGTEGKDGVTPQFGIGTVSEGHTADVTMTGTKENPVLNFVMPKVTTEDIVAVQDTQPTAEETAIWFPETPPTPVQVPTYAEHLELKEDVDSKVADVKYKGTSLVDQDGNAIIPPAQSTVPGLMWTGSGYGLKAADANGNSAGRIQIDQAIPSQIKGFSDQYRPITPKYLPDAVFHGMAKAAGDDTQSSSQNPVGTYTDDAKEAIQEMLNVPDATENETAHAALMTEITKADETLNGTEGESHSETIIVDESVDFTGANTINAQVSGSLKWQVPGDTSRQSYVIDITGVTKIVLTANATEKTIVTFLPNNYASPVNNADVDYVGSNGRIAIETNASQTFSVADESIPATAKYICIYKRIVSGSVRDFTPASCVFTKTETITVIVGAKQGIVDVLQGGQQYKKCHITPAAYEGIIDSDGWIATRTTTSKNFVTRYMKINGGSFGASVSSGFTVKPYIYDNNFMLITSGTEGQTISRERGAGEEYVRLLIVSTNADAKNTILTNSGLSLTNLDDTFDVTVCTNATALMTEGTPESDADAIKNVNILNGLEEILNQSGGGTILMSAGTWWLHESKSIKMRSNVSIKGDGIGSTILLKSSITITGTEPVFTCQGMDENYLDTFTEDFQHTDFTIDCSQWVAALTQYDNKMKAYRGHYCKRALFENLEIIGSPATGFGIDYCHRLTVTNCIFTNCGRAWGTLANNGCNAIGIGTGAWTEENIIISNNQIDSPGRHGIFIENQGAKSASTASGVTKARGQIITGNIITNGRWCGIGISWGQDVTIGDNRVYNCRGAGINLFKQIRKATVNNNVVFGCGTAQADISNYDYTIAEADMGGIRIDAEGVLSGGSCDVIVICGNTSTENNGAGIHKVGSDSSYPSTAVMIANNICKDNSGNDMQFEGGGSYYDVNGNMLAGGDISVDASTWSNCSFQSSN